MEKIPLIFCLWHSTVIVYDSRFYQKIFFLVQVTVLLADLHGYLDNQKAPWPLLAQRTKYYEFIIKVSSECIPIPTSLLSFSTLAGMAVWHVLHVP